MSVTIPPDIIVVGGGGGGSIVLPLAPTIVSIGQSNGIVAVGIIQSPTTGSYPIASLQLYRGATSAGPWVQIDSESISLVTLVTHDFDDAPQFGVQEWYTATATDSQGNVSPYSNVVTWTAYGNPVTFEANNLSAAAFGPYPLLGQDVYLDPYTNEAVIGPNGDLMTVNGLFCLAQDLRIRIFTDLGALLWARTYGFQKPIGQGQGKPTVEAQILQASVIDCIQQDPRVQLVLGVQIGQANQDSWGVAYQLMAIGVEDPFRANIVTPYFLQ